MKSIITVVTALLIVINGQGQDLYNVNHKIEVPLVVGGAALTWLGFQKIADKPLSTPEQILALSEDDVWKINRSAIHPFDEKWDSRSNIFFYGAMPYPFLLLFDDRVRSEGWDFITMYFETLALTGTSYSWTAASVDKYRPYAYDPGTEFAKRANKGAKNSFYGGHPSLTAAATVFAAKVYSDYHPESALKYGLWTLAAGTTLANAYYRWRGGFHFVTDLAIGVTWGSLIGYMVPTIHKRGFLRNSDLSIMPFTGDFNGISFVYNIK